MTLSPIEKEALKELRRALKLAHNAVGHLNADLPKRNPLRADVYNADRALAEAARWLDALQNS